MSGGAGGRHQRVRSLSPVRARTLAECYLEKLAAPAKHLEWFEHSGHNPRYEEPDRFNTFMTGTVLAEVAARAARA